jgi:hypothetical protein
MRRAGAATRSDRRLVIPERLDERAGRDDLAGPQQQRREHDPFLGRQHGDRRPVRRANWSEQSELNWLSCSELNWFLRSEFRHD